MVAKAGILLVNSGITSSKFDEEDFTRWYEDVHIPDLFAASGIKSAFRYRSSTVGKVQLPYMVIYPMRDVTRPLSEILPDVDNAIFELAEFESQFYVLLGSRGGEGIQAPLSHIVAVTFDASTDNLDTLYANSLPEGPVPVRSRILKLYPILPPPTSGSEDDIQKPSPNYLVLHEFDSVPEIGVLESRPDITIASFDLLKVLGDANIDFL